MIDKMGNVACLLFLLLAPVLSATATDISSALNESEDLIARSVPNISEYKLIKAENVFIDGNYIGEESWFFTYRKKVEIPVSQSVPFATGGELFVLYNSLSNTIKVTHGE